MEAILNQLLGQAWGLVAGSLVTVFVGGIGVWIWINIGAQKIAKEKPAIIINRIAFLIQKYIKLYVKDVNLTDIVLKDLDSAGDRFNEFWDDGLKGIKR